MTRGTIYVLKSGGIGVMPTDTIYGLVGSALNKKTVDRIYKARKRNPVKPLIILISSFADLKFFGARVSAAQQKILNKFWPGMVSVVLPCRNKKFAYLHRGTKSLAFRLPAKKKLLSMIMKTGPLVAPSANPEGYPPAKNIKEAKKYFGKASDFYVDGGHIASKPSALIKIKGRAIIMLRDGLDIA